MRRVEREPAVLVALVVAPLLVALGALLWRPWAPVLDLAMTELRVRDVGGRFTPRIGLPGRIGDFPDQGSHPGPWSFYLVAPFYRLAGASAWGMQLGSVMINSVSFGALVLVGRRLAGRSGALALAAVAALAIRGYGLNVLTHPWNPYFPLALWLLLLVSAWAVLAGEEHFVVVVAVCATVAAQTHVPYLVSCVTVAVLVLVVLVARTARATGNDRRDLVRWTGASLGLTVVLWVPPIVDQLRRDPGNMTMLYRHFTGETDEPTVTTMTALRIFLRHLDVFGAGWRLLVDADGFVARSGDPYTSGFDGSALAGAVVLLAWVGAAWWARRHEHRVLNSLNLVLAVALLAGLLSMSRIFGKIWFYLTLWAWSTMLLVMLSVAWTAWLALRSRRELPRRVAEGVAVALGATATALSLGAVGMHDVPEPNLSDGLRELVGPTLDAIDAERGSAVGRDGRYLVFWQDSVFIGSQGYGLVNELERRGVEVGVHDTWRVPVTHHRVMPTGSYDAELHLVSGVYLDEWRERDGFVEVASVDVRSDAERTRFESLRDRVLTRLDELGREELAETVDRNLFGASLDPSLPLDVIDDLSEMLELGEPVSVFVAPPGSSF